MQNTWLILLPPLIALTCVFITKRLMTSLLIGIGSAALIAANFSPWASFMLASDRLWEQLVDPANLFLYGFSLTVGLLIIVINHTGGALAFTKKATQHIKSPIHAQAMSLVLSFALFIDDYLSNLTVGYVMRPLTDLFKIPRAKLAFLVHSLSGPFVILVPVSSWGVIILLAFTNAHIDALVTASTSVIGNPFFLYLRAIPFIFYSLFTIIGVWYIVMRTISYGPMKSHELQALKNSPQTMMTPNNGSSIDTMGSSGSLADFALPLIVLVATIICAWAAFKPHNAFETFFVLFVCVVIATSTAIIRGLFTGSITWNQLPKMGIESVKLMYSALIVVMLAMTLGAMLETDLGVSTFLAHLMEGSLSATMLPFIFFMVSTIVSVLLGSAWGTILLLTPTAVRMVTTLSGVAIPATAAALPLLIPVLAAVLSGAVAGNHISPISDTTILAATSSGSTPLEHAYTQFPYTIPMLVGTGIAFLSAGLLAHYGLGISWLVSFSLGLGTCIGLLHGANRWYASKNS